MSDQEASNSAASVYRVLARKYRPTDFAGLIGQEAMVRTLSNAIQSGRLAHAFVLTGVRGVGKTTTARIIARALNCVGADGTGGPTIEPCGICENCRAIAEDRHVDVMEMDAASRTGVGDIREIIEGVRYRPTQARFKIYIIDEVHMLSNQAFNALLKTLEEPPEHVKFIFATTEIRKIPVTVLSRCQRFDLKRVEIDVLSRHFAAIVTKEGAEIEADALAMIARAADGSVRDGLSLLDQAISHGAGLVTAAQVREMLNLADRGRIFDLFDVVMKGDLPAALGQIADQYAGGADPVVMLQDLLELTHWLTRLKLVPDQPDSLAVSETERVRGREMSRSLSMAHLTRAWQMLLKGVGEARTAPHPLQAMEMCIVRLAYVADLPGPAEVIEQLRNGQGGGSGPGPGPVGGGGSGGGGQMRAASGVSGSGGAAAGAVARGAPMMAAPSPVQAQAHAQAPVASLPMPSSLAEIAKLCEEKREIVLSAEVANNIHLVRCEPGLLEFRPSEGAASDLAGRLRTKLSDWSGRQWQVIVSRSPGAPTLQQEKVGAERAKRESAIQHPLVQAVLAAFPGAAVTRVLETAGEEDEAGGEAEDAYADPADNMMPDDLSFGDDDL